MALDKFILWDFDGTLAYHESGTWEDLFYMILSNSKLDGLIDLEKTESALLSSLPWNNSNLKHPVFKSNIAWWDYVYELFIQKIKVNDEEKKIFRSIFEKILNEYIDKKNWHLFYETLMVLRSSKNVGYTNIIVSNHIPELYSLVNYFGIDKYITKIFCSSDIGWEKPNNAFFEFVFETIPKNRIAYFIGNSFRSDYLGAVNNDLHFLSVRKKIPNYDYCFLNLEDAYSFVEQERRSTMSPV